MRERHDTIESHAWEGEECSITDRRGLTLHAHPYGEARTLATVHFDRAWGVAKANEFGSLSRPRLQHLEISME